jgi:hypothetical protein
MLTPSRRPTTSPWRRRRREKGSIAGFDSDIKGERRRGFHEAIISEEFLAAQTRGWRQPRLVSIGQIWDGMTTPERRGA